MKTLLIGSTIESIVSAGVDKKDVYLVSDGSSDDKALQGMARSIGVLDLPVNGGKSLAIAKGIKHFNLAVCMSKFTSSADNKMPRSERLAGRFSTIPNAILQKQ